MYRLSLTGDQGMEQVRQVLFSSSLADFIGGAAGIEISMPIGSLLDTTFKLESNLTTGYGWELLPSTGIGFSRAGEPSFTARSRGYGVPSVETLVLHPDYMGNAVIRLVYRRSFEPDEAVTRHLFIHLSAQALQIDLSDPDPKVIANADTGVPPQTPNPIAEIPVKGALPSSWDWRTAGIVPAVRNQGSCGGCWAFGTVGVMESAIVKAGGPMTDLSEQFLISCNTSGWSCSGGLTAHKWHYDTLAINQAAIGAVLEADDPYTAANGTCSLSYNHPYQLSGWQFIVPSEFTMPTVDQIKNAIYTYGPVTAGVCADSGWDGYTGGVYNPAANGCSGSTNHQIVIVGWDDATSTWIVRNSWGPSWGESGYMHLKWDTTGTKSRVGEGTSWVAWVGDTPAPFGKSSPAHGSFDQPASPLLSWGTSSTAESYEYCLDASNNSLCNTSWISTSTSTSVPLGSLASGTYSWQVRAINASGTTQANAGAWWSFTIGPGQSVYLPLVVKSAPLPGSFNKTAPANNATNQSTAPTLSWGASSDFTSYEYCLDASNNNFCDAAWVSTAASTSAPLSGLAASSTYYWQVRANNAAGSTYADAGTWWSFTTAAASTGPKAGFWQSNTGDEFYVTPDQANVSSFSVYVNVSGCGSYKITHALSVPIGNNQFSFTGPFYASGSFDSSTSAHGTDGLNSFNISGCGTVNGGPWSWTATWQNSNQPAPHSMDEGSSPSITILPFPALYHHLIGNH